MDRQQKLVNDFTLFSALPVLFNMYKDKDSNLISDPEASFGVVTTHRASKTDGSDEVDH